MRDISGHRFVTTGRCTGVLFVVFVVLACGCVRSIPTLPEPQEANTKPLGILGLRSADATPMVLYQRPPKGLVGGFLRGTARGAMIGAHVGTEVAKFFVLSTPAMVEKCNNLNTRLNCGYFYITVPLVGLLFLIALPPTVSTLGGIQGGFTSYTSAEVEKWEKVLVEAQDTLQIQATMRESVRHSVASCCRLFLPTSTTADSTGVDTMLETEVLELGLAEAETTFEEPVKPNETTSAIDSPFAGAFAPIMAIFHKSRTSLYMLVQTKLLGVGDNTLLDERKFGYLSTPRSSFEWAEDNAVHFRAELLAAYKKLADEIVENVVQSALPPHRENQAFGPPHDIYMTIEAKQTPGEVKACVSNEGEKTLKSHTGSGEHELVPKAGFEPAHPCGR